MLEALLESLITIRILRIKIGIDIGIFEEMIIFIIFSADIM